MEPICLVHQRLDWMRASLDGFSFDGAVVLEIKCPWNGHDQLTVQEGKIPAHHYAQLQHQLEVSEAHEAHYWSFDGSEGILVRVEPEHDYIARLLEAEAWFWRRVLEDRWPEETEDELNLSDDPDWRMAALRYREARIRLDQAAVAEEAARQRLSTLASARRTWGCGVEVVKGTRKGAVDYSSIPELRGVDLERYRKPAVEVVKVNLLRGQ